MGDFTGTDFNMELPEKFADLQINGGDLKEGTPTNELQRILECPVCKAVPLPPIFNCAKGHIICGKCREQLKECGLCTANFTDSRNFVLEDIVLSSKIACEFRELGCAMILSGCDFKGHVEKCDFRPLRCFQGSFEGCKHAVVDFQNYTKHLATVHKMKEQQHRDGGFVITHSLTDSRITDTTWTGMYLYFEGKAFLTRTYLRADVLHLTMCIIGSDMDASKYKVRMQFRRAGDAEFVPFEVTVPVISIRKSYEEISRDSLHVILTKAMIRSFCRIDEMPEKRQKLKWNVDYKIMSNADNKFAFHHSHGHR
ncbi:unnamed protein product [Allacma fusca]|uniref:RING-type E3 ubiquitin transferase n=1 Tax=Allacma fusca TaxID=39272 RepID=A0A8J2KPW9_9HEXA|nr:unnamed protein product [Allacma fusca]